MYTLKKFYLKKKLQNIICIGSDQFFSATQRSMAAKFQGEMTLLICPF